MPVPTLANTANPRGMGYAVALGTDLFRGAFGPGRELQVETAPLEPPAFDTRSNPEELNEEFGRTFARSDFTGGEGLDFAHTRDERVNKDSRFFDSFNVDVSPPESGGLREFKLTRDLVLSAPTDGATANPGRVGRMAYNGTRLYVVAPLSLHSTLPTADPLVWTSETVYAGEGVTGEVQDVATLGTDVYAALSTNGIHRYTGGAWAHWSDIQATRVWAVKSRIIASVGTSIYEAAAGAVPTPLYTLPTGKFWTDVADAGAAIIAAASDGNIYAFAPDTTTGALRQYAQSPVVDEYVSALAAAQGVLLYATREATGSGVTARLWRAELADDLTVVNAQLLREWRSDTLDRTVYRILAARDAFYISAAENAYIETLESETPEQNTSFVWRYDLATGGLSRVYPTGTDLTPPGMLVINRRLFVAGVFDPIGVSPPILWFYRESTTDYHPEGYVIGPLGDFFSSAVKSWVGARLDADDLPVVADGRSVNLYYTTDPDALADPIHASWTLAASWDTASDITSDEIPLTGVESRYIAGMVTITRSTDKLSTPVVRSFGFRAFPGGGGGADNVDQIIQVPINVSDQLERSNKRRQKVKNLGQRDLARLQALQGEALTMTLYHPGGSTQYRGLVESVGAPKHSPERGSASLYSMLRFRGREVA